MTWSTIGEVVDLTMISWSLGSHSIDPSCIHRFLCINNQKPSSKAHIGFSFNSSFSLLVLDVDRIKRSKQLMKGKSVSSSLVPNFSYSVQWYVMDALETKWLLRPWMNFTISLVLDKNVPQLSILTVESTWTEVKAPKWYPIWQLQKKHFSKLSFECNFFRFGNFSPTLHVTRKIMKIDGSVNHWWRLLGSNEAIKKQLGFSALLICQHVKNREF